MTSALETAREAHQAGRIDDAMAAYRQALAEQPSYVAAHNLGTLLSDRLDWREALPVLQLADRLNPHRTPTELMLAYVLGRLQRFEEAERFARAVLAREPENPHAQERLGHLLLGQGRYAEAWPFWEQREVRRTSFLHRSGLPEWRGGSLAGKSLVVWGEQGIGDEVMAARFLPRLRELGCERIVVACLPPNVRLFQAMGADEVIARPGQLRLSTPHDWVLLFSLPARFASTRETLSGRPYLPRARTAEGGRIGLALTGASANTTDRLRSIDPGLARRIPNAELLEPAGDTLDSLQRLASLDLVITVDTAWAHLAGAIGVPCWVLVSPDAADWRWLPVGAERSPWYASVRLFWQKTPGDWSGVMDEVAAALAQRA